MSEKISEFSKEEVDKAMKHLQKGNALDKNGVKAEMSKNCEDVREMILGAFSMIIFLEAQALEMAAMVVKRTQSIRQQKMMCQEVTDVEEKHHRSMRDQEELAKEGEVEMRHIEETRSLHLGPTEELDLRDKRFCDAANKAVERGAVPGFVELEEGHKKKSEAEGGQAGGRVVGERGLGGGDGRRGEERGCGDAF